MPDSLRRYAVVLCRDWLRSTYSRDLALVDDMTVADEHDRIAFDVRSLYDSQETAEREAQQNVLRLLNEDAEGAYLLWAPPGADIPADEPERSAFAALVRDTASALAPGQRKEVRFPVTLELRKQENEGNIINVTGGMADQWAMFTGLVSGTYRLNSAAIHRLPEKNEEQEALRAAIIERANSLSLGERVNIDAIDAWTLQRLPQDATPHGFVLFAAPPTPEPNAGSLVRRSLRILLKESHIALGGISLKDAYRCLVVLGAFAYERTETISTALRGFDPTIYAGMDFILLLTDGHVKPIYVSPRVRL